MCGIVGIRTDRKGNGVDLKDLMCMRDALIHRGPDGSGLWISNDRTVGFGHTRLSIIDLSPAASQPMSNWEKTVWVVFNGEIYNHLELRRQLTDMGYRFDTDHSDTEVIIRAYEAWGKDCVKKFRGMFAFALWDEQKRRLFLARDHLGIKPIYYGVFGNTLYFASEIKAILKASKVIPEVREEGLCDFLSFMCVPAPETLFKNIKKLPAGHYLIISEDGTHECRCYWDVFDDVEQLNDYSEEDHIHRLADELNESIRFHGVSDVPVGVFLSGGIDSSANAILFNRYTSYPLKTFTVGFTNVNSYVNEFDYARRIADLIHSDHHEATIRYEDVIRFIPQMIRHQDEPIADPVCVPVYYVSKLAATHGIKVCQVGEGSDELFCGYPVWRKHLNLNQYIRNPLVHWGVRMAADFFYRRRYEKVWEYEIMRRAAEDQFTFWGGAEVFPEHIKSDLLSDTYKKRLGDYRSYQVIARLRKQFLNYRDKADILDWMSYVDLKLRLPELLLMRVDKMSMAVSLETRVPFLDRKFVSFALSIPKSIRVKKRQLKYVLKKALEKELPQEILQRKKQGFGNPVVEFAKHGLGRLSRDIILEFVDRTDYFDRSKVQKWVFDRPNASFWYLFNLAAWHKSYICREDLMPDVERSLSASRVLN